MSDRRRNQGFFATGTWPWPDKKVTEVIAPRRGPGSSAPTPRFSASVASWRDMSHVKGRFASIERVDVCNMSGVIQAESDEITFVMEVFKEQYEMKPRFVCKGHQIDLYFPQQKVAVYGDTARGLKADAALRKALTDELGGMHVCSISASKALHRTAYASRGAGLQLGPARFDPGWVPSSEQGRSQGRVNRGPLLFCVTKN